MNWQNTNKTKRSRQDQLKQQFPYLLSSANHMDVGCFREFLVALIDNNCRPALRAWKSISKFVGPAIQHDHCWKACRHFDCAIVAVPDFDRLSASFLFLLLSIFFSAGWHESSLGWCGYVVSRFPLFVLCIFPFFPNFGKCSWRK